jgi:hypothetical protein
MAAYPEHRGGWYQDDGVWEEDEEAAYNIRYGRLPETHKVSFADEGVPGPFNYIGFFKTGWVDLFEPDDTENYMEYYWDRNIHNPNLWVHRARCYTCNRPAKTHIEDHGICDDNQFHTCGANNAT